MIFHNGFLDTVASTSVCNLIKSNTVGIINHLHHALIGSSLFMVKYEYLFIMGAIVSF